MDTSNQDIKAIFDKAFGQKSSKPFIVFGDSKITYGDLKTSVLKFSTYFHHIGINAGERVVFSSKNERFVCLFYLSLIANGITAVYLDPDTGPERAVGIINHCKPEFIALDPRIRDLWNLSHESEGKIVTINPISKKKTFRLITEGPGIPSGLFPEFTEELPETDIPANIEPGSDAYILFTSGTTSAPKGVRISYYALFSHLATLSSVYQIDKDSGIFNNLILSHSDGVVHGPLLALYNTATVYRPFPFSIQRIEDIFDIVYRENITHWIMVPTMAGLIYRFKQNDSDTLKSKHFRYVISCGGKLEALLWQQFEDKFQARIINSYGLTETVTGGLYAGPDDDSHVIGTIGKPVDCEAKVMDEHQQEKAIGEQGEIWMKGSLLMSGYLDAQDATLETVAGEWLKTGDIGFKGKDGCFRITGRKKLVIISGGVNIIPEEVTEVLHSHPAVEEAVTFGIEDVLWGEIVACAVVVNKHSVVSKEELAEYCRKHLEERKVPSQVYFVEGLPHGPSGKVIIQRVKEMVAEIKRKEKETTLDITAFLEIVSQVFQMPLDPLSLELIAEETAAWDSISHLVLIAEMEKRFGIEFTAMEVMNIKVLSDLYSITERKIKAAGSGTESWNKVSGRAAGNLPTDIK